MALRIYTRTGDEGTTGLFGGGRVSKDDIRVDAYGEVDELNSAIGLAMSMEPMPRVDDILAPIQRDLFAMGALLATPDRGTMQRQLAKARLDEQRITELEKAMDDGDYELEPLKHFIMPGGTPKAAALHLARTVCRRAERRVVHAARNVEVPAVVLIYLNRLSDLLFTLARVANRRAGRPEQEW